VKRAAVVVAVLALPRIAAAQCPSRPADAAGYEGYVYGVPEKTYDTAKVRVHYATSGTHAPDPATTRGDGVPDTVAMAGDIGEDALTRYADMGFAPPPSDVSCAATNGGDERLDIYLVKYQSGADGTTVKCACSGAKCASFVLTDATFKGRGYPSVKEGFTTVVSHELFHTVQNAYNANTEERYWQEGTAQWAMKTLHPELVDFENQLPAFFGDTKKSLDVGASGATSGYFYGSAVWPLFLTLRNGKDTVRTVWEAEGNGTSVFDATKAYIEKDFPLFWAWNYGTKDKVGTGGYPDAAKYPEVKASNVGSLEDGANGITSGLSAFFFAGDVDGEVSIDTDATRNAAALVPLDGSGKPNLEEAKPLPVTFTGSALVVVTGITTKKTDAPFTIKIGTPAVNPTAPPPSDDGGCNCAAAHGSSSPWGVAAFLALFSMIRAKARARSSSDRRLRR